MGSSRIERDRVDLVEAAMDITELSRQLERSDRVEGTTLMTLEQETRHLHDMVCRCIDHDKAENALHAEIGATARRISGILEGILHAVPAAS